MKKTYSAYGKVKMPKPFLYNLYSGIMATWLKTKAKLKVDIVDTLPEQFVLVGNHPSGFDNFYCIDSIKPKKTYPNNYILLVLIFHRLHTKCLLYVIHVQITIHFRLIQGIYL